MLKSRGCNDMIVGVVDILKDNGFNVTAANQYGKLWDLNDYGLDLGPYLIRLDREILCPEFVCANVDSFEPTGVYITHLRREAGFGQTVSMYGYLGGQSYILTDVPSS